MPSLFPQLFTYQFFAPTILRIALGVFFILFSYLKFRDISGKTELFFSLGIKPAKFWVMFMAILEVIIGVLLVFGFLVQSAAGISALVMIAAIFTVGRVTKGRGLHVALLIISLSLLISGPGALAIDLPL